MVVCSGSVAVARARTVARLAGETFIGRSWASKKTRELFDVSQFSATGALFYIIKCIFNPNTENGQKSMLIWPDLGGGDRGNRANRTGALCFRGGMGGSLRHV